MKILIGSHHFYPSTGGIETATNLLAREFTRRGHEVRVVTQTLGTGGFDFAVLRRPSLGELFRAVKWCDVFLQNNISLRTIWPLLFLRRPLFITQQTWVAAPDRRSHGSHPIKRFVPRFANRFAISHAIARTMPAPSNVIGNPYDETIFKCDPAIERSRDLIFVGRLVSDKGADLLIDSLTLLRARSLQPSVTIVGDGPERASLENKVQAAQLPVIFAGAHDSAETARFLNQHRILVVPSRWAEPFGIVALEGIACGCVVVGSSEGGLPEAIGPCGLTFPNGDIAALADTLATLLREPAQIESLRAKSGPHLAQFTSVRIADLYLEKMAAVLR